MENEVFSFLITALGKGPDIVEDMSAFKISLKFEGFERFEEFRVLCSA